MIQALTFHDLFGSSEKTCSGGMSRSITDMSIAVRRLHDVLPNDKAIIDTYIEALLLFVSDIRAHALGEDAETKSMKLPGLCKALVAGDNTLVEYPFFEKAAQKAQELLKATPACTVNDLYMWLLEDYYDWSVEEFKESIELGCYQNISEKDYLARYEAMVSKLPDPEILTDLHNAYLSTYLSPSPLSVFHLGFYQGVADYLLESLQNS